MHGTAVIHPVNNAFLGFNACIFACESMASRGVCASGVPGSSSLLTGSSCLTISADVTATRQMARRKPERVHQLELSYYAAELLLFYTAQWLR